MTDGKQRGFIHKFNKKIVIPTLCALAVITAGVTVAYFTSAARSKNSFTIGTNTITIDENFKPPKELKTGLNTYKKQIKIKNTGTTDAFVRVYVEFSDSDAGNCSFISSNAPSSVSIPGGTSFSDASEALKSAGYKSHDEFWSTDGPTNGWAYIPDDESNESDELGGYFYYTKHIAPGEKTDDLINTIATYYETADQVKDYEVIVYAESVQTADINGETFEDSKWQKAWDEFTSRK